MFNPKFGHLNKKKKKKLEGHTAKTVWETRKNNQINSNLIAVFSAVLLPFFSI